MANLQDGVGISGGSTLIGGTGAGQDLTLKSTSDNTKGSVFIAPDNGETIVSGRASTLAINSSANMFAGVTPKLEVLTGTANTSAYQELVVVRHNGVDVNTYLRRTGLLLKLSDETTYDPMYPTSETDKTGGMVLDSSDAFANFPSLSLVTANEKRLTVDFFGNVGIGTTSPACLLDVNGAVKTGALVAGAIAASSVTTSGAIAAGGALTSGGLLSANEGFALTLGSDATGDMYYRGSSGHFSRVGLGSPGQVLTAGSSAPFWGDTQNVTPVGSYLFMATETAPDGYLRCNGDAVSRTEYADLFAVIGIVYGEGDHTTTFNLPDTRGLFFRDLDSSRGLDYGRLLDEVYQDDVFKSHTHSYIKPTTDGSATGNADPHPDGPLISANTGATGGSETRPKNLAIVTFIKYGIYYDPT